MFIAVVLIIVFCLLGYIFGRGQASLFYDEQIDFMQDVLDSKRKTIKKLRNKVEVLKDEEAADWWKRGEESPF
jgi:hypothetical protein